MPAELITSHHLTAKRWTERFPPKTPGIYKFDEQKINRLPLDRWRQFCSIQYREFAPGVQQIVGLVGCKFPLGERPNLQFCNKQRVPGHPYCKVHHALCHIKK